MGLTALGDYLAGKLSDGPAKDWIAQASPEDLLKAGTQAAQISDAWTIALKSS
jgi:hypothetical protein